MRNLTRSRALVFIIILEGVLILVPTALGHPPIYSDNLNQNIPMRSLAAQIIKSGSFPLWNPLSWSGTPLLASFNAGVLSPTILPFLLLHVQWAFSIDLWLLFVAGDIACFLLVGEMGGSILASLLSGVTFGLSGQFLAQSQHVDMVQGIAFSTWALFFALKLVRAESLRQGIIWALLFGYAFALVIVGGAPEAMLDGAIMIGAFLAVMIFESSSPKRAIVLLGIGAFIALAITAPQWLTGLAFTSASTRGGISPTYFEAGPWSSLFLPLTILPFATGGYGGLTVPDYIGSYNLGEVSTFLPALVLVVALVGVLSRRFSSFTGRTRVAVMVMGAVSLLLALGSVVHPLELLMAHVPIYNRQRLPSRNMFAVDLAAILLFGGTFDHLWGERRRLSRPLPMTLFAVGSTIATFAIVFVVLMVTVPYSLYSWLSTLERPTGGRYLSLLWIGAFEALLVVASVVGLFLIFSRREKIGRVIVVITFALQLMDYAGQTLLLQPPPYSPYASSATTLNTSISSLPAGERYAVYDPHLGLYTALLQDGMPAMNLLTGTAGVQGYGSLAISSYTTPTATKPQGLIDPYLINGYARSRLNLNVLLTGTRYFLRESPPPPPSTAGSNPTSLAGSLPRATTPTETVERSSFYLGSALPLSFVALHLPAGTTASCIKSVYVFTPTGAKKLSRSYTEPGTTTVVFEATTTKPLAYEVSIRSCSVIPQINGTPVMQIEVGSGPTLYEVDGILEHVVSPRLWRFSQGPDPVGVFTSRTTYDQPMRASNGIALSSIHLTSSGNDSVTVDASRSGVLLRSEAYLKDWFAVARFSSGRTTTLDVGDSQSLQSVKLPAGHYSLTFSYRPSSLRKSEILAALGGLATVLLAAGALFYSPRAPRRRTPRPPRSESRRRRRSRSSRPKRRWRPLI